MLHARPDIGVHDGRRDPFVFLDLRQDVRRARDVEVRQLAPETLDGCDFVRRVFVGVEIADRDRCRARGAHLLDGGAQRLVVHGREHRTIRAEPLAHADPEVTRHQRRRGRRAEIVAVVFQPLPHLEHIAVPLRRQEGDLGPLPLEERVRGDRRAVHDPVRAAEHVSQGQAEPPCEFL
jgi:hypothetical protein